MARLVTIFFTFSVLMTDQVFAAEQFADETKLQWSLEVEKDSGSKKYSGAEIDKLLKEGITHKELNVKCEMRLQRKSIKYNPSGKDGYTRNQEQVSTQCQYGDSKIELEEVVCADGQGKGKVGTIFSDKAQIKLSKSGKSFFLKLTCTRK